MPPKKRKQKYTKESKLAVIREIVENGKSVTQAATDHGLHRNTVAVWFKKYQKDGPPAFDRTPRMETINWNGLTLGAIGLLVALSVVIMIKTFVLGGSHDLLLSKPGISRLEISVLSLLLAPFVIREMLTIRDRLTSSSHRPHMKTSIQEFMFPLAALSVSILIYAATIRILNL